MTADPQNIYDRINFYFKRILTKEWLKDLSVNNQLIQYLIKNGYENDQIESLYEEYGHYGRYSSEYYDHHENIYFKERRIFDLCIDLLCYKLDHREIILSDKKITNNTDIVILKTILSKMKYYGESEVYCPQREISIMTGLSYNTISNSLKRLQKNNFIKITETIDHEKGFNNYMKNTYILGSKFQRSVFALLYSENIKNYSFVDDDIDDGEIKLYQLDYEWDLLESTGQVIRDIQFSEYDKISKCVRKSSRNRQYSFLKELAAFREIPYRFTLSSLWETSKDVYRKHGLPVQSKPVLDFINANQNRIVSVKDIEDGTQISPATIRRIINKLMCDTSMKIESVPRKGFIFRSQYTQKHEQEIVTKNDLEGIRERREERIWNERRKHIRRIQEIHREKLDNEIDAKNGSL